MRWLQLGTNANEQKLAEQWYLDLLIEYQFLLLLLLLNIGQDLLLLGHGFLQSLHEQWPVDDINKKVI